IIHLNVGKIRAIDSLEVVHTPFPDNRAHTDVTGVNHHPPVKRTKIRLQLAGIAEWVIIPRES
ncbi:MAG TPA: hypothetical protein VKK79_15340, partial [Candidatus Lokiarchaeia archaeon]|nr:hypothetical protein [Candidatus Lokiarchaeia archaeon]